MRKPRLLMLTESSFLSTGYAKYSLELLNRLHSTGKYDIAEISVYGQAQDDRFNSIPWQCYLTTPQNPEEEQQYYASISNEFGEYKINDILLDFKPDHVFTIKDYWMWSFLLRTPFRRLFKLHVMPTADAEPQNIEWIDAYNRCDSILSYTDWSMELLRKAYDKIPLKGIAPPCANKDIFKPCKNKNHHRKTFELDEKAKIFGTVMRNQPRKQFLDLTDHFRTWLEKTGHKDCFLYFHTAHPDVGWDMSEIIKNSGISNKILFTYKCRNCGLLKVHFYQDAITVCNKCKQAAMALPGTQNGVSDEELAKIYNLFDVYIQYSNCEGFGIPIVEAASCGIPQIVINYSGMEDFIGKLNAYPIEPLSYVAESCTHRKFAVMNEEGCHKALDYYIDNWSKLKQLSIKTKVSCNKNFDWNDVARKWMEIFDSYPIEDTWNSPPRLHNPLPLENIPQNTLTEMVRYMILYVAHRPELVNTHYEARLVRDLTWTKSRHVQNVSSEMTLQRGRMDDFKIEHCYEALKNLCIENNIWEEKRNATRT